MSNSFTFSQTTPATVWNINHNLNAYPVSDVIINGPDGVEKALPLSVVYNDSNNITVSFNASYSGAVRLFGTWGFALAQRGVDTSDSIVL